MRVPVEKIQDKMLISIPNALEHPSIAQYGLDRLKLHALRRAGKLRAISIVSKKRPKQQF